MSALRKKRLFGDETDLFFQPRFPGRLPAPPPHIRYISIDLAYIIGILNNCRSSEQLICKFNAGNGKNEQ